jgi:hypothetical protein
LPNSANTAWIVSCVIWSNARNGIPIIKHIDGRSYRREEYARARYNSIVKSLEESGHEIVELDDSCGKSCEGIRAFDICDKKKRNVSSYTVVFITRNPVWSQR